VSSPNATAAFDASPDFQPGAGQAVALAEARFAVVAFQDETGISWLKPLKRGFRHCVLYLPLGPGEWLLVDPLAHRLRLARFAWAPGADLAADLRRGGRLALTVPIEVPPQDLAFPFLFSCVEVVKRVLGIQGASIRTPYELYLVLRLKATDCPSIPFHLGSLKEHLLHKFRLPGWFVTRSRQAQPSEGSPPMGSIFSKPPSAPPPVIVQEPAADPAEEAAQAARERRRRAQAETLATSYRGVEEETGAAAPARKKLIGE